MWFYHVSLVVMTCILLPLFLFFSSGPSCLISYPYCVVTSVHFPSFILVWSPHLHFFSLFSLFCLYSSWFSLCSSFFSSPPLVSFLFHSFLSSPPFFPSSHLLSSPTFLSSLPSLLSPSSPVHLLCLLTSSPLLSPPSPLIRPVRYQRQQYSAWHPLKNRPWPNPALFRAGTSSKPASREWWSSLCRSDKCSSACSPDLTMELDLQSGASPLPSDQTSPGRVCLFLWKLTLGVAWAAGGWSRAFGARWLWQSI